MSVYCDDVVEGPETFDMRLTLANSNDEVMLGRNVTSEGYIIDSTGKPNLMHITQSSYYIILCIIVVVSFSQSSYEAMEDDGSVTMVVLLSQSSSIPFQLTINTTDVTAESKHVIIIDNVHTVYLRMCSQILVTSMKA